MHVSSAKRHQRLSASQTLSGMQAGPSSPCKRPVLSFSSLIAFKYASQMDWRQIQNKRNVPPPWFQLLKCPCRLSLLLQTLSVCSYQHCQHSVTEHSGHLDKGPAFAHSRLECSRLNPVNQITSHGSGVWKHKCICIHTNSHIMCFAMHCQSLATWLEVLVLERFDGRSWLVSSWSMCPSEWQGQKVRKLSALLMRNEKYRSSSNSPYSTFSAFTFSSVSKDPSPRLDQ